MSSAKLNFVLTKCEFTIKENGTVSPLCLKRNHERKHFIQVSVAKTSIKNFMIEIEPIYSNKQLSECRPSDDKLTTIGVGAGGG